MTTRSALILAGLALSSAAWAEEVSFDRVPLKKRTRVDYSSRMVLAVDLDIDLGDEHIATQLSLEETERLGFRVLAVDRDGPTRIEVRFLEMSSRESGLGEDKFERSPLTGQTLQVGQVGSHLLVWTEDGAISEDVVIVSAAAQAWATFEDLSAFVGELESETVEIGHRIDMTSASQLMSVTGSEAFKVTNGGITLTGVRREKRRTWGTFAIEFAGHSLPGAELDLELDVRGTALVDTRTGLMSQMSMSGPVTMKSITEEGGRTVQLEGRGTVSYEQRATLR